MQIGKPIQLRWQLLFQHEIVVIVPTEGATKKNNKLVRERHDRVLQRMLFFSRVAKLAGGSLLQALQFNMPDRGGCDDGTCVSDDVSHNDCVAHPNIAT